MVGERQQGRPGGAGSGRGPWDGPADRGQTLHDYTVGISLFIITLSAVLAGLFGFIGPLSTGVGSEEISQSDRIATTVVQNLTTGRQPNELDADRLSDALGRSESELRTRWGLQRSAQFNVTLTTLNGSRIVSYDGSKLAAGSRYQGNAAGSAARIVTLGEGICQPGCRLAVRTW
ncbi:DUF7287 family protein [Halosimplex amylolyticum]|uniref:DUF7287 family protein n=1 Tax=Halosimplex amylolyticum TaxID=3396616 RepID=UPI003F54C655